MGRQGNKGLHGSKGGNRTTTYKSHKSHSYSPLQLNVIQMEKIKWLFDAGDQ